jgi:transposase
MEWLTKPKFETVEWPPQSPDLSPIELVWNILKMRLNQLNPKPRTKEEISSAMHHLYAKLDDEVRKKTIDTFRENLKKCIENSGHPINDYHAAKKVKETYHTDYEMDESSDDDYME